MQYTRAFRANQRAGSLFIDTETQNTDYPYRLLAPAADMSIVLSGLLAEIDYCNFKSEVHDTLSDDDSYQDFLMNVWSEGLGIQDG